MQVNNWATILLSISRLEAPLFGVMTSISSIKMMHGALEAACENICLILASDSPETPDTISGAEIFKKSAPSSPAIAR